MPKDPVMLLSFVNTQLRDFYSSLDDFAKSFNVNPQEIIEKLATINYTYDSQQNKFI